MWSIWQLAVRSNDRAVDNARRAATELSRAAVERHEVELFLAGRSTAPEPPRVEVVPDARAAATR